MSELCQTIVFSNKAYNAIIRESFDKDPVETGGILLGHILDNGMWIVMEVLPPGIHCIFERAYFEYDDSFVNYLAQSVANQYKIPLELLGLWHRHPGSMDFFSATDDQTNTTFAAQNSYGVISGLVNLDPKFRLTMYHLGRATTPTSDARPRYEKIPIEVGDDIIPEEYFELRYYDGDESKLHPVVDKATRAARTTEVSSSSANPGNRQPKADGPADNALHPASYGPSRKSGFIPENKPKAVFLSIINFFRRSRLLFILLLLVIFSLSIKSSWKYLKTVQENIIEWVKGKSKKQSPIQTIDIRIGEVVSLDRFRPNSIKSNDIKWICASNSLKLNGNTATGVKQGKDTISVSCDGKTEAVVAINVISNQYHLSRSDLSLKVGQKDTLGIVPEVKRAKWVSSNKEVATVDRNGVVTAHKAGQCLVTCETKESNIDTCSVNVSAEDDVKRPLQQEAETEEDTTHLMAFLPLKPSDYED